MGGTDLREIESERYICCVGGADLWETESKRYGRPGLWWVSGRVLYCSVLDVGPTNSSGLCVQFI